MIIYYVYILPMIFFVPYYNWQYANDNGFVKWILLGEVVATGEGIIWPYYIIASKQTESNIDHLKESIEYSNEATRLDNQGQSFSSPTETEMKKYIDLKRKALEEGKLVDVEKLNNDHPNFGNHFRNEYLKGLQLLVDCYDKQQNQYIIQAQILLDNWSDWYSANLENIKARNKIEVQAKQNALPPSAEEPKLNPDELDRYSSVLKKLNDGMITKSDIDKLRGVFIDYTNRTGRNLSKDEYDSFIGIIKISADYMFELGTSLLYSWDQKKIFTTSKFDELYKTMKALKLRKEEKLDADMETLKAAARNQNYVEDESERKFYFGRDIILQHMKQNELSNANMEKISEMMKEFIK